MTNSTLEALTRRLEAVERALQLRPATSAGKDWRRVVGMFDDSEFMKEVDANGQAIREADREAARHEESAQ